MNKNPWHHCIIMCTLMIIVYIGGNRLNGIVDIWNFLIGQNFTLSLQFLEIFFIL